MTAKQELRKLVESLDELQAEKCLAVVRTQLKNGAEHPLPDELPTRSELLKIDLATRRAILRRFPAEVDMEEAREWGKVGADAVKHIDD